MRGQNVMAITNWSFHDPLIQTYTLPYVRLIKKNLTPAGKIFLITLEQEQLKIKPSDKALIKKQLAAEGIDWQDFPFTEFGAKAIIQQVIRLVRLWFLCIT